MGDTHHIGIVACSAEGAALCYKTICSESAPYLGKHAHPEISMHTPSLSDYNDCINRDDWLGVGEIMLMSANKLAQIGANFLICPDNTIHQALHYIEARSPLPWLHIAQVVTQKIIQKKYKRVGLTGTRWLVESNVYPDKLNAHNIDFKLPTIEERNHINHIIMDQLVPGIINSESVRYFQDDGCDAVILGCTEIPLIINDQNSVLPTLDSTRLLARAAIQKAIGG
jgi:aspartate racemase